MRGPQEIDRPPAGPMRVAVVAMKPQLRGRIRRNVETALAMGAEVCVFTTDAGKDFFVGLHHPRLQVRFVEAVSVLQFLNAWVRARAERQVKVREQLVARHERILHAVFWDSLPKTLTGGTRIRVPWRLRLRRGRRSAVLGAIRLGRWFRRFWINVYRSGWRRAIAGGRRALRPWHRLSRWHDFWRKSQVAVQEWGPDVIASSDLPGIVGASRAARRLMVPHLHDCHELYLESTHLRRYERLLLWPVERFYMRRASVVTCVNRSISREYARRYGVPSAVVRNCAPRPTHGVPTDIRRLAHLPSWASVVLYQGGFAPGRGLDVLIDAASGFPAGTWLVLLGDGRYKTELLDIIFTRGVGDRIRIVGAVSPDDLLAVTASADVGLVPYQPVSLNNRLALPNKVFEYTAAGIPVVVSDVPELRSLVEDGRCGLVYDPYEASDLVTQVGTLLDPSSYGLFKRNAASFGERNCWENERIILVSAYRSIVNEWRGRPDPRLTRSRVEYQRLLRQLESSPDPAAVVAANGCGIFGYAPQPRLPRALELAARHARA